MDTLLALVGAVFAMVVVVILVAAARHGAAPLASLPDDRTKPVAQRGAVYSAKLLDRDRELVLHL